MRKYHLLPLSLFLASIAWSACGDAFSNGNGTEPTPYEISTPAQLQSLNECLANDTLHFKLTQDINLTEYLSEGGAGNNDGEGWEPIGYSNGGSSSSFSGTFNGNGHRIIGLWINRPDSNDVGLFGILGEVGSIADVGVKISLQGVTGKYSVGGLVGQNKGSISRSYVEDGNIKGINDVGGLVGFNAEYASIDNSYSTAFVEGTDTGAGNENGIGGLVGSNDGAIDYSYAAGLVTATESVSNVGGLVGYKTTNGIISQSYYDSDVSGQSDAGKGDGISTEEMKSNDTDGIYYFWSYDEIWLLSNGNYPTLRLQETVKGNLAAAVVDVTYVGDGDDSYVWTGENIIPNLSVYLGGNLLASSAYTVSYSNNKQVGAATATITGNAPYYGSISETFYIGLEACGAGFLTEGTKTDPYQIANAKQLDAVHNCVGSSLIDPYDKIYKYFVLTADIDLAGYVNEGGAGWRPIGDLYNVFSGHFDGNGYKIKGLWSNHPESNNVGLFGKTSGSEIKNVGVELAEKGIIGYNNVGGFIGSSQYDTISASYVTGKVAGKSYVGGLIGYSTNNVIENNYVKGTVTVDEDGDAGGLIGVLSDYSSSSTKISNSYAAVNESITSLIGGTVGAGVLIEDSYIDKTAAELKLLVAEIWDADVWQFIGANYPTHRWETDIAKAVIAPIGDQTYTGQPLPANITVTLRETYLAKDTAFSYDLSSNNVIVSDAGSVTIVGIEPYHGSKSADFKILKAALTAPTNLTATAVYGETLGEAEVDWPTDVGGVEGTWELVDSTSSVGTVPAPAPLLAKFTHTNSNYEQITENISVALTVGKANGEGTVSLANWIYGSPNTPVPVSSTNGIDSVTYSYAGVAPTVYEASAVQPSAVGDYTITATFAATDNYNSVTSAPVDFAISKAAYNITPPELAATYSATNTIASVTLGAGYAWVDSTEKLTVAKSSYAAIYNADPANYDTLTLNITVVVAKGTPAYTLPTNLTATYGDTLADVLLPEGWAWKDAPTTSVGNVSDVGNLFAAVFTPTDVANYNTAEEELSIVVAKGTPDYTLPTNLTATYGETLADVLLSEGWAWKDAPTTSVGNVSDVGNSFAAIFTPADIANYNTAEEELSIVVAKANGEGTVSLANWIYGSPNTPVPVSATNGIDSVTYSYAGVDPTVYEASAVQPSTVGDYTITATFAATDNYNSVTSAPVDFAISKAAYNITPPELAATYSATNTISSVALEAGYAWVDSTEKLTVAKSSYAAIYNADPANYDTLALNITVVVAKGTPAYTLPTNLTATYGQTLADVDIPSGWAWKDTLTTSVGDSTDETGRNFIAVFTPTDVANYNTAEEFLSIVVSPTPEYTITYKNLGGASNPNLLTYTVLDTTIVIANPGERLGYEFSSWSTATIPSGSTGNKEITAVWDTLLYRIIDSESGDTIASYTINDSLTLAPPSRPNYTFAGWFNVLGYKVTEIKQGATGDILVTAKWFAANYQISLYHNAEIIPWNVTYGEPIGELPNAPRDGFTFEGWWSEDLGGEQYTASTVYTDTTLKELFAHWSQIRYQLSLDSDGGKIDQSSVEVFDGLGVGTLPTPAKAGYAFLGWYNGTAKYNYETVFKVNDFGDNYTLIAKWLEIVPDTYIVEFDANAPDASVIPDKKAVVDELIFGALPVPERPGYTFMGWRTADSTEVSFSTIYDKDSTELNHLYAVWALTTYTISLQATGVDLDNNIKIVEPEKKVGNLPVPSRDGYAFMGWFSEPNGLGILYTSKTVFTAASNITLYAYQKPLYYLQLNPMGGILNDSLKSVIRGNAIRTLPTPVRPGFVFDGWFTSLDAEGVLFPPDSVVNQAGVINLFAKWLLNAPSNYQVVFETGNGALEVGGQTEKTVSFGMPVGALPKALYTAAADSLIFAGWYTLPNGDGEHWTPETIFNQTQDQVLFAYYHNPDLEEEIVAAEFSANNWLFAIGDTLTLMYDPGEDAAISSFKKIVYSGVNVGTLALPTREDYEFAGWFTSRIGGLEFTSKSKIMENTTIYAHWISPSYEVALDPGEDATVLIDALYFEKGVEVGWLPEPERENYTFAGWFNAQTGGSRYIYSTVYRDITVKTLYAHWTQNPYIIDLDARGGLVTPNAIATAKDDEVGVLPPANRDTYIFSGWLSSFDDETYNPETKVSDNNLYAAWLPSSPNASSLELDPNGGEEVTPTNIIKVAKGYEVGVLPKASREGFVFDGWWTAPTGGERYIYATHYTDTEVKKLYAHWAPPPWKIALRANGGKINPDTVSVPKTLQTPTFLPEPTRASFAFAGWFSEEDGGDKFEDGSAPESDLTLYARWVPKYTLAFSPNEGAALKTASKDVVANTAIGAMPVPERTGFVFNGWWSGVSGGERYTADSIYKWTENKQLYAHWEPVGTKHAYIITLKSMDGTSPDTTKVVYKGWTVGPLPELSRTGYIFKGWFSNVVKGTQYRDTTTFSIEGNIYLFAQWDVEPDSGDGEDGGDGGDGTPIIAGNVPSVANETVIRAVNGGIAIEGAPAGAKISIYNIHGALVYSTPSYIGHVSLRPGFYVVKAGNMRKIIGVK